MGQLGLLFLLFILVSNKSTLSSFANQYINQLLSQQT